MGSEVPVVQARTIHAVELEIPECVSGLNAINDRQLPADKIYGIESRIDIASASCFVLASGEIPLIGIWLFVNCVRQNVLLVAFPLTCVRYAHGPFAHTGEQPAERAGGYDYVWEESDGAL